MNRLMMKIAQVAVVAALINGCGGGSDGGEGQMATSSAPLSPGYTLYDSGTVCTVGGVAMHCCPSGFAMVGAHIANNVFTCSQLNMVGSTVLSATVRNGMLACPYGMVMVGLHDIQQRAACRWPTNSVSYEYVDGNPPTSNSYPMHVCRGGYAMSGITSASNLFTCAY